MDPDKALEILLKAIERGDWERVIEEAEFLKKWTDMGGHAPVLPEHMR